MTSRQQRRAAERKAHKQAIRNGRAASTILHSQAAPPSAASPLASPVRPSDTTDYAALAKEAGSSILYPGEELARYRAHLLFFLQQHTPAPGVETVIVTRLADLQWRLARTARLEAAVMALGRRQHAELFADADPSLRDALIDAHVLEASGSTLKRLHLQEARLRRFYDNDLAELEAMHRDAEVFDDSSAAATLSAAFAPNPALPSPIPNLQNGFEFSNMPALELNVDSTGIHPDLKILFESEFSDILPHDQL